MKSLNQNNPSVPPRLCGENPREARKTVEIVR